MNDLEKIREWLETYEGMPKDENFQIDYVLEDSESAGLISNGIIEISRFQDNIGNWFIENQMNLILCIVMAKPPEHDLISTRNAQWLLDFQKWVQKQSVLNKTPKFGNIDIEDEIFRAQYGAANDIRDSNNITYNVSLLIQYKVMIEEE